VKPILKKKRKKSGLTYFMADKEPNIEESEKWLNKISKNNSALLNKLIIW